MNSPAHQITDLPDLLTAEQEVDLFRRIEAGVLARAALDGELEAPPDATPEELAWLATDGEAAWEHFLGANVRMVRRLAWDAHRRSGVDVDELFQEGFVALARASQRFDVRQGVKFSTYGFGWVRNAVMEHVVRRGGSLDQTVWRARQARVLRERRAAMEFLLGRLVPDRELAADVGRSLGWVKETLLADRDHLGDLPLEDMPLACPRSAGEFGRCELAAPDWLAGLGSLEGRVLRLRFGLDDGIEHGYEQCGRLLGVSPSTVRRVERDALRHARALLRPHGQRVRATEVLPVAA